MVGGTNIVDVGNEAIQTLLEDIPSVNGFKPSGKPVVPTETKFNGTLAFKTQLAGTLRNHAAVAVVYIIPVTAKENVALAS